MIRPTTGLFTVAILTMLNACDGGSNPAATNAAAPRLTGQLEIDAQQKRLAACDKRLDHYRKLGVWVNGGVRPGVSMSGWDQLDDAEKSEVFDIAACVGSAGQVAEKMVTVTEEGNGPEIETRRIANDRDFLAEQGDPAT